MNEELLKHTRAKLMKAIRQLEVSLSRTASLLGKPLDSLSEDQQERLEGLSGRFGRAADIASRRYLRLLVLRDDRDFQGTARDLFDVCEKRGFISSTEKWMRLREIRNLVVHEYEDEELEKLFIEIHALAAEIIQLKALP